MCGSTSGFLKEDPQRPRPSLDELKHRINNQCIALGLLSVENLPPQPAEQSSPNKPDKSGAYVKTSPK